MVAEVTHNLLTFTFFFFLEKLAIYYFTNTDIVHI